MKILRVQCSKCGKRAISVGKKRFTKLGDRGWWCTWNYSMWVCKRH